MSQLERERGDRWADKLQARGWWVQKLPASSMAGLPDWLVGKPSEAGTRWVEAKTLEAVLDAKGRRPTRACTGAQRFFLDRVSRAGDHASLLVQGPLTYLELAWASADVPLTARAFNAVGYSYGP